MPEASNKASMSPMAWAAICSFSISRPTMYSSKVSFRMMLRMLTLACSEASLWIRPRLNWTTPEAWLPDLYVDPAARRRGHARALLQACADEARAHGCHRLILESGHQRAEAHRLYESFGFEHYARSYQLLLA